LELGNLEIEFGVLSFEFWVVFSTGFMHWGFGKWGIVELRYWDIERPMQLLVSYVSFNNRHKGVEILSRHKTYKG
jgi:hypothetical protein